MGFSRRPEHEDFWLMAEVVQDLDSAADDGLGLERLALADPDSMAYMGIQRAMRIANPDPSRMAMDGRTARTVETIGAAWMDGFVAGMEFQRRKDKRGQ